MYGKAYVLRFDCSPYLHPFLCVKYYRRGMHAKDPV
jgi:hypothetical protein